MPPHAHPQPQISQPSSVPVPDPGTFSTHTNIPIISLALAFAAFFILCLGACACSYTRTRPRRTDAHQRLRFAPVPTNPTDERSWVAFAPDSPGFELGGLGLQLGATDQVLDNKEDLPPYSERQRSLRLSAKRANVPTLLVSSPVASEEEMRGLLGLSPALATPLTPPLPTYASPSLR